jgi:hypothetical protein
MKSLSGYLDDEFTLLNKRDLLEILETYQLFNIVEKFILLLKHNPKQGPDIGIISSGLLIGVNTNIKVLDPGRQQKIELLFADLIFVIFIDFLKSRPLERALILKEIKKHSFTTCNLMGYDFNVFKKLIDACAANSINDITYSVEINKSKFIWTGKGRLEELVYQLSSRKLIKNKGPFFDLFLKTPAEDTIVRWDFERKGHLAHLLHELYKKDLIDIVSNRGYFSYAEKHFAGFDGAVLKTNSLKKLSSAIHAQPGRHNQIIKEVNEIIGKVTALH